MPPYPQIFATHKIINAPDDHSVSYKVLARKWRPQHFRDMLGQEPVLRALASALDTNRLHHAYLFTGMRGVGKTTIARIFAKCLNCETKGVTSDPCGTCSSCQDIDAGRFFDLIEVDAASQTKVENTRELLENVPYAPASGRYKVYLIDEVHMFSNHSFNALLKTLEEPPEHVKFILATTDPQKVPATVLSRCLQFNLKRMPSGVLTDYLAQILSEENIEHDRSALELIARASEGSVRDSLSLVEQAAASGQGAIRAGDVESMLGRVSVDRLLQLLNTLATGDIQSVFEQVEALAEYAPDFSDLLGELLSLLHRVAMLRSVPGSLDENAPGFDRLSDMAVNMDPDAVQLFYQIGLHARRDMPFAPDQREAFDMALLRMHQFKPAADTFSAPSPSGGAPGTSSGVTGESPTTAEPSVAQPANSTSHGSSASVHGAAAPAVTAPEVPSTALNAKADPPASAIPKEALAAAFAPMNKNQRAESAKEPPRGLPVRGAVSAGASRAAEPTEPEVTKAPATQNAESSAENAQPAVSDKAIDAEQRPNAISDSAKEPEQKSVTSSIDKSAIQSSDWAQLVSELDIAGMPFQLASNCIWVGMQGSAVTLNIKSEHEHLCDKQFPSRLEQALGLWLEQEVKLTINIVSETLVTPAAIAEKKAADELAAAHASIQHDPIVKQLVESVDGSIDEASVRPVGHTSNEP